MPNPEVQTSNDTESLQTPTSPKQSNEDGAIPDTLKTGEDKNSSTENGIEQKHITQDEILDEFTQQINLVFKTFCKDFQFESGKSEHCEGESEDNDVSEAKTEETNGQESCPTCTLDQVESLKAEVQNKISSLLNDKGEIDIG